MKDSIKKQSLPALASINARLYESLSFYICDPSRKKGA